jgi:hypothetical protein
MDTRTLRELENDVKAYRKYAKKTSQNNLAKSQKGKAKVMSRNEYNLYKKQVLTQ